MTRIDPTMTTELPEGGLPAVREGKPVLDDNPKQGTSRPPAIISRPSVVSALTPSNMAETMKLAELMAASTLVPPAFQKKPADCLMVVMQAVRWQMDPFAVIQECSVIQGKLMYNGKLVAAVLNSRGNLTRRLSYWYNGEGRERTITVTGQLQGETNSRTVEVILKNAATNAKVWQQQPDQQLMYHGVRVWARRHTPELMLGVWSPEEFEDQAEAVANGVSIHHPDDYADGTPERLTKPKEEPKHSRAEKAADSWELKRARWKAEMDMCKTTDALHEWGTKNSIPVSGDPGREAIYKYFNETMEALEHAALADVVVHDSDDAEPRPATAADFDRPSISERAIALRTKADADLTPDEVADLLRS